MTWQKEAIKHSKDQMPREAVGLVLNVRGKLKYYPCNNLAITDHQCFILDPEDYIKADNTGDIVGIFHSHPVNPPTPSQADKVSCEASGLPWYIVNPSSEEWAYLEPCGYKPPLLGRQWVWGVTDCWSLVRDWYKETKNISLRDWDRPLTPQEFNDKPMFEDCAWRTNFRELRPSEKLEDGDVLLMSILCPTLNHVALFFEGDVIHHLTDRLSCREPYSQWLLNCTGGKYRYVA